MYSFFKCVQCSDRSLHPLPVFFNNICIPHIVDARLKDSAIVFKCHTVFPMTQKYGSISRWITAVPDILRLYDTGD